MRRRPLEHLVQCLDVVGMYELLERPLEQVTPLVSEHPLDGWVQVSETAFLIDDHGHVGSLLDDGTKPGFGVGGIS